MHVGGQQYVAPFAVVVNREVSTGYPDVDGIEVRARHIGELDGLLSRADDGEVGDRTIAVVVAARADGGRREVRDGVDTAVPVVQVADVPIVRGAKVCACDAGETRRRRRLGGPRGDGAVFTADGTSRLPHPGQE
jgi:hypothetical protein